MKAVKWLGTSHDDVCGFPDCARKQTGYQLYRVQNGFEPNDWKPMAIVGAGVREIRIHTKDEFRLVYVATFEEAVYILHAFQKKTRQTSKHDLELAKLRFEQMVKERKKKK